MNFLLLAIYFILDSVHAVPLQEHLIRHQWENFKVQHNKFYETIEEDEYRLAVFMENMDTIIKQNDLYRRGLTTYKMGMNQFGDLRDDEFQKYYLLPDSLSKDDYSLEKHDIVANNNHVIYYDHAITKQRLPETVDWGLMGAVTRVKDQGKCGSCYAFSATGALEAQQYLLTKKLKSLSEQNIIDCTYKTKKWKNRGCLGGNVNTAFNYIIANGGIDTDKSYPYKAAKNDNCMFSKEKIGAKMHSIIKVRPGNETDLRRAVARVGPTSVMVDALGMRFYSGGLYDNPKCRSDKFTHAVLAIGYGTYRNLDYWLVKNSWGSKWGESGYIRMSRNKNNQCAIATKALIPII